MEETEQIQQKLPSQEFDYFKIGKILLSRWYWIVAAIVICYIGANIYLWYTPKTYQTQATLKLEEKKSEITDLLGAIANTDKTQSRVQSETYVLESRSLLLDAVKDLNYPVSFYIEGRVRKNELYPQKPLDIKLIKFDTLNFYQDIITYKPVNQNSFNLTYNLNGHIVSNDFPFNNPITVGPTTFSISNTNGDTRSATYSFRFNSVDELIGRARGGLQINEIVKNSGILVLRQTDANPQFAAGVLNAIMKEYLVYDRIQKQQSASQIISFIDEQLDTIHRKVKLSENSIELYKQNSKLMDVSSAAQTQLTKGNEMEAQRTVLNIQLKSINDFKQQLVKETNTPLNFNIDGNIDPASNTLIANYNLLLSDKNYLLKKFISSSTQIQDVDRQIASVKKSILDNINLLIARTTDKVNYLQTQLKDINNRIATFPVAERDLASLNRDFEVNEKVYTFLSEKKLDAQISRSAIAPGASIVEQAQPNYGPVAPDVHSIKRNAIILGLLLGLGSIILIRILNPYIYDKETVESLTTIPIIGVIRKFPYKKGGNNNDILVLSQPKSIFAESVRSVRTNLSFLAAEKENKIICITSEVAGEGKSFVAVNLSSTLSLIDKKVILIAADLRRSKLHKTFQVANDIGLSNFLANQVSAEEIILHTSQPNFDFIPSGPVPPNPSELLHTDKMKVLIDALKLKYDIVMIDTAPVGLVSDSIPLIRLSDINVFVIRSGKSKFYAATIPQRIDHEYNLNNSVIILNAFEEDLLHSRYYTTKFTGGNYGTRYYYYSDYIGYESSGYYVDSKKRKWWDIRRWFK